MSRIIFKPVYFLTVLSSATFNFYYIERSYVFHFHLKPHKILNIYALQIFSVLHTAVFLMLIFVLLKG